MQCALAARSLFFAPRSTRSPSAPNRSAAPGFAQQRSALAAMAAPSSSRRIVVTFDVDGTLIESTGPRANHAHKAAFAAAFKSVYNTDTHIDVISHHGGTDPLILLKASRRRRRWRPQPAGSAAADAGPRHARSRANCRRRRRSLNARVAP